MLFLFPHSMCTPSFSSKCSLSNPGLTVAVEKNEMFSLNQINSCFYRRPFTCLPVSLLTQLPPRMRITWKRRVFLWKETNDCWQQITHGGLIYMTCASAIDIRPGCQGSPLAFRIIYHLSKSPSLF